VIAIIGILAGIILVSVQSAKGKARDVRRKTELNQLSHVLEAYFINQNKYPESSSDSNCSNRDKKVENVNDTSCFYQDLTQYGLQGSAPVDPAGNNYYRYQSDGSYFILKSTLEDGEIFILTSSGGNLAIVVNDNSSISQEVGTYYQKRRGISSGQIIHIRTTTGETISYDDYVTQIRDPIKSFLDERGLKNVVLYIVTTYGVPYKVTDTAHKDTYGSTFSVDSYLSDMYDKQSLWYSGVLNPYNKTFYNTYTNGTHKAGEHFDSSHGTYLVMRLDGPSEKIAKGLVDKAIYAGRYMGPNIGKGYMAGQAYLNDAANTLCGPIETAGYECIRDSNVTGGNNPLWHVYSGGWPEGNYYKNVWGPWPPGAVPMNFRSGTAVRTIRDTNDALVVPNNLAADVTATWGVVAEPFANLIPQPTALYDYFLNGHFNLAESVYMATSRLKWRWVIIGDPLYIVPRQTAEDTEKPKITNAKQILSGSQINISWDNFTSESGSPEVTYGCVEYVGGSVCSESLLVSFGVMKKNYLSQHSVSIPAGVTQIKIVATDPAGNESIKEF